MPLTLIACAALTLALGWWIFTATPDEPALTPRQIKREALQERKAAVFDNLKDLHFEHLAGKLTDADYQRTRQMLEREAAAVVQSLDQLSS